MEKHPHVCRCTFFSAPPHTPVTTASPPTALSPRPMSTCPRAQDFLLGCGRGIEGAFGANSTLVSFSALALNTHLCHRIKTEFPAQKGSCLSPAPPPCTSYPLPVHSWNQSGQGTVAPKAGGSSGPSCGRLEGLAGRFPRPPQPVQVFAAVPRPPVTPRQITGRQARESLLFVLCGLWLVSFS